MSIVTWQGVYPAILTPFKSDDSIDFNTFKLNLDAQLDAGIDGIVLAGSLGEASTLSSEEKKALLLYCKEVSQQRAPIIVNIAEQSTKCAVQAHEGGGKRGRCRNLLPPMLYKAMRGTRSCIQTVAENTSLPI